MVNSWGKDAGDICIHLCRFTPQFVVIREINKFVQIKNLCNLCTEICVICGSERRK